MSLRILLRKCIKNSSPFFFTLVTLIMTSTGSFAAPLSAPLSGAQINYPNLSGEVKTELQSEWVTAADEPIKERGNTFLNTDLSIDLQLTQHLTIESTTLLEPVRDFDPGKNTYFDEEAVFIEELLLKYENGPWELIAGKFNPYYKGSREQERGIFTEEFSKEYEITGKIGLGSSYSYQNNVMGKATLSANAFVNDATFLAKTIGHDKQDKCNNNHELSSAVLLEGYNLAGIKTLYYQLGYRHLDACKLGDDRETGFLATVGNIVDFRLSKRLKTDLLTEFSYVEDFEGTNNNNQYYSISSVTTLDDVWNLSIGYTARVTSVGDIIEDEAIIKGRNSHDHLVTISAGYNSGKGLRIDAGWLNTEESRLDTSTLGLLVRYEAYF